MKLVGLFAAAAVLAFASAASAQAPVPNGGPSISQNPTAEKPAVSTPKAVRRPVKRRRHRR